MTEQTRLCCYVKDDFCWPCYVALAVTWDESYREEYEAIFGKSDVQQSNSMEVVE